MKRLILLRLLTLSVLALLMLNSCRKEKDIPATITDVDGNVYHTVIIGNQVWLKENLQTTRYRNGDLLVTTNPSTLNITGEISPKYQWAVNGNEANVDVYGRLYTWYAANDSRGLCPAGWHLPSDEEWTTFTDFLGGLQIAGAALKEEGTLHWLSPNAGATNETGFTALPAGCRYYSGGFDDLTKYAYWWASSTSTTDVGWVRATWYETGEVLSFTSNMKHGFSVRCLMD